MLARSIYALFVDALAAKPSCPHFSPHVYKANKEQTLKAIAKYMKIQDREVLEEAFRSYDFPLKPYPAKEYFELPTQEVARQDPRVLKENPEHFTDSSLIKELDESGFIDKLTREYGLKK